MSKQRKVNNLRIGSRVIVRQHIGNKEHTFTGTVTQTLSAQFVYEPDNEGSTRMCLYASDWEYEK